MEITLKQLRKIIKEEIRIPSHIHQKLLKQYIDFNEDDICTGVLLILKQNNSTSNDQLRKNILMALIQSDQQIFDIAEFNEALNQKNIEVVNDLLAIYGAEIVEDENANLELNYLNT